MNINYTTGDTIRNSGNPSQYMPPAQRPTEEWAGSEVRSYQNYIRPVANLFENDRENNAFIKDLYKGINTENEYAVISGCTVAKTTISSSSYYEIRHGAFISNGAVYYIYPACEAVSQQLESEFVEKGLGTLQLKLNYNYNNDTYDFSAKVNGIPFEIQDNTANTAAGIINKIITNLFTVSNPPTIESHIILPIFKIANNVTNHIFFNNAVQAATTIPSNSVYFATVTNGVVSYDSTKKKLSAIDGSRINTTSGHKIKNSSLENNTIKIGSTEIALGASSASLADVSSINGVSLSAASGVTITGSSGAEIRATTGYTLGSACSKGVSTWIDPYSSGSDDENKLTVQSAVRQFVQTKINTMSREDHVAFQNGISVSGNPSDFGSNVSLLTGAKLSLDNNTDASRVSNAVSGNASIYTKGGIEAAKNIYADGDIIGRNNGTYSLRSLKENITPFKKSATKLINDIKVVNYNYIADPEKNHKVGFIADDTDEIFATKNHNIMDQSNCIGVLLKAVQELSGEIKKLKEEINELKSNNATGGEE